jgi:uracil-DNA glycosylase
VILGSISLGCVVSVVPMLPSIPSGWRSVLKEETAKPYYRALDAFLDQELAGGRAILPAPKDIFKALAATSYKQVRVLLVGQDPYPTPGHAHGLCFSVQPTVRPLPLSLRNIYRELQEDLGCRIPNNGYLEPWAKQGILMLNTVLTVRAYQANSHQARGWEQFTDRMIELVAGKETRVVFVLWGREAQKKQRLITQSHHAVVACAHPSPLSVRKFFGCRCFSCINRSLAEAGLTPIDWQIPNV